MSLFSFTKIAIIVIIVLQCCFSSKILQLTNKNIGNVLKSQSQIIVLYHHPLCQFSSNYKNQFVSTHQSTELGQIVGVVDCSLQKVLCDRHNISKYPYILKMSNSQQSPTIINPFLYISNLDESYKYKDEYKSAHIAQLLKQSPHFIVVLFEEEGLPVQQSDRVKGVTWANRVFYQQPMSQSNVSRVLAGFVKNMLGCWIYQLVNHNIDKHHCGDTYQSSAHLINTVNKFIQNKKQKQLTNSNENKQKSRDEVLQNTKNNSLYDSSDSTSDTIIGYSQFLQLLNNFQHNIEVSTRPKLSMCYYVYLWSDKCQHCSYKNDMTVLTRIIDEHYALNKDNEHQVLLKHKIHSYNTQNNKIVSDSQIFVHLGLPIAKSQSQDVVIVPDIQAICLSTGNNREQSSTKLEIKHLSTIVAAQNMRRFVKQVVDHQIHIASKGVQSSSSEL